jgi:excisionase family DNA binding protein
VNLATVRTTLEALVADAAGVELPMLLGELERARAMAWMRLAPSHDGTRAQADYLTIREVVARLRLSRARVYELVRSGDLPTVKLGTRGTRVRRVDLEQWEKRPRAPMGGVARVLHPTRARPRVATAQPATRTHPKANGQGVHETVV